MHDRLRRRSTFDDEVSDGDISGSSEYAEEDSSGCERSRDSWCTFLLHIHHSHIFDLLMRIHPSTEDELITQYCQEFIDPNQVETADKLYELCERIRGCIVDLIETNRVQRTVADLLWPTSSDSWRLNDTGKERARRFALCGGTYSILHHSLLFNLLLRNHPISGEQLMKLYFERFVDSDKVQSDRETRQLSERLARSLSDLIEVHFIDQHDDLLRPADRLSFPTLEDEIDELAHRLDH